MLHARGSSSSSSSSAVFSWGGLEVSAGVVAGGVCAVFALCLAVLALALWR